MPSVNKQSLREEFDTLKERFRRLSAEGAMTAETRSLFEAMWMLFELLMAVFMEKHTPKNNSNSSNPSSRTPKDDTATAHPGAKSKGKAQTNARSGNTRTIETIEVIPVHQCKICGEDLSGITSDQHERRTRIDIVFEKVITHLDAQIKQCPACQSQTKGCFPGDMPGPLQYGPGIKAYALNLLIAQMVSLRRVQQSLMTLIGQTISETIILKYVMQLHHALEPWEHSAKEQILAMPALHVDETSLRVDKKNLWIHVCSSGNITLKFLHPRRGCQAIEAIGLIPRYEGTVIHDCWASYLAYDHCGHGLCGAHLLRELSFIVDAHRYAWAANLKRLLQQACSLVSKRKRKKLSQAEYKRLQRRYRHILTRGKKELPSIPPKQNGKRGRIAKSDAHNLWERLKHHETAVLLFARVPYVSFTNNRAERDLRMSKVKQKVSGCFRTIAYAEAYCRISSYLQTMANQGFNPLIAIQMALFPQLTEGGG